MPGGLRRPLRCADARDRAAIAAQISARARSSGIAGSLDQRADAVAVDQREQPVGGRVAVVDGSNSPAATPSAIASREPLVHARVQPRGGRRAARACARRAATARPTASSRRAAARAAAGTARSSPRAARARPGSVSGSTCGCRRRARRSARAPRRAGRRGRRSGSARSAADTPASIAIRAIRTPSMPSRAISRTAASRIRCRALASRAARLELGRSTAANATRSGAHDDARTRARARARSSTRS